MRINRYKKMTLLIAAVLCFVSVLVLIVPKVAMGDIDIQSGEVYSVSRTIDGDTFEIAYMWKKATIRMIGIDTPETVDPRKPEQCYGKEASEETKSILSGQEVKIVLDPAKEPRDKYRRYLAYVYLLDGRLMNLHLLERGFAREYTFGRAYSKQADFRAAENEAKQNGVGMWSECDNNS